MVRGPLIYVTIICFRKIITHWGLVQESGAVNGTDGSQKRVEEFSYNNFKCGGRNMFKRFVTETNIIILLRLLFCSTTFGF